MRISSPAFEGMNRIPAKYTCDVENVSPPLEIFDVPQNAKNLVFILDDPDAPNGTFTHWIMWNIDPLSLVIPENGIPQGAQEGFNDANKKGYTGPCPPTGTHRYRFKLFALNKKLDLLPTAKRSDLDEELKDGIIDSAELVGTYSRDPS
jgi:hypothetical protein